MKHAFAGAHCRIVDPEEVLAKVRAWGDSRKVEVLLADARVVFGKDHLESALLHAERAQANETMIARTVAMEGLRYLSVRRQVVDAIRVAGIRRGTKEAALAILGDASPDELLRELGWIRDDAVLGPTGKSLRVLGIGQREEGTVPKSERVDLVLERVALIDGYR